MLLADLGPIHRDRMEARGYSLRTLRQYAIAQRVFLRYLALTLGHEPALDDLTLDNAIAWQLEMQRRGLTQQTISNYTIMIRGWAKWIASYIPKLFPDGSPLEGLVAPKPEKTIPDRLSVQEISALLGACPTMHYGKRNAAIILLLWDSGLRLSEIVSLKRSDLRLSEDGRLGRVTVQLGKGRKKRASGLGDRTSDAIRDYLQTSQAKGLEPDDWLFRGRIRARLGERGLHIMLKVLAEMAGVESERVHAHAFRHTFGRAQVKMGTNTLALKEWMGHEKTTTTDHYAKLEATELDDAFVSVVDHALGRANGIQKRGNGRRS